MEHTKELLSVPLSALAASPLNVRRYAGGQVEELAALIDSQGLLHNLVVTEQVGRRGKGKTPGVQPVRFAVVAGERRRRALMLLHSRGRLSKDHEVPCELVTAERALEVSIAENSGREPLHAADEFDAFKALIEQGKGIEDVAARFGVSPLTVQRRLKLAALSPKLLALYRQDGINLDQLMALTLSDDHAVQEANWFGVPQWEQSAAAIRRRLTADEVEVARSGLARFVGIEAYETAGGVVRRDLFDSEQSRFLSDPALLRRLALERLEANAEALRNEGWAWVEARLDVDSQALRQFAKAEYDLRKPTGEERRELVELQRRQRELAQQYDALSESEEPNADEAEAIGLEEDDIDQKVRAIEHGLRAWAADVKASAGVIVTVNHEGDVQVIRGLVREVDRKALDAARRKGARATHETASMKGTASSQTGEDACDRSSDEGRPAGTERKRAEFSDALSRRLAAHRTLALQVALSRNVPVALAALTNAFAQRVLGDEYQRAGQAMQVTAVAAGPAVAAAADDAKAAQAWLALSAARDAWVERLPDDRAAWFAWLQERPQTDVLDLLVLCSALTVNTLPGAARAAEADALASAIGLDMADWWEPTAEGFLNHVSKAQIVQALKEAGPGLAADGVEGMKKDALVSTALARLKGTRWLPAPLRPQQG